LLLRAHNCFSPRTLILFLSLALSHTHKHRAAVSPNPPRTRHQHLPPHPHTHHLFLSLSLSPFRMTQYFTILSLILSHETIRSCIFSLTHRALDSLYPRTDKRMRLVLDTNIYLHTNRDAERTWDQVCIYMCVCGCVCVYTRVVCLFVCTLSVHVYVLSLCVGCFL